MGRDLGLGVADSLRASVKATQVRATPVAACSESGWAVPPWRMIPTRRAFTRASSKILDSHANLLPSHVAGPAHVQVRLRAAREGYWVEEWWRRAEAVAGGCG